MEFVRADRTVEIREAEFLPPLSAQNKPVNCSVVLTP